MECHKCPYQGTQRCLSCHPTDKLTNKGQTFISLDAGGAQTLGEVEAALSTVGADDPDDYEIDERSYSEGERQGALRLLQYFMALDPAEVSLLLMSLAQPFAQTAREIGVDRSALSHRWRKLVKKHPELEMILHPNGSGLHKGQGVGRVSKLSKPYRGGAD